MFPDAIGGGVFWLESNRQTPLDICIYRGSFSTRISATHLATLAEECPYVRKIPVVNTEAIADNPPEADKYTGLEPPFPAYHLLQLLPRCGH